MIKKTKGYTLLEIMLVVGIITLMMVSIYGIASKKYSEYLADKQAQYVSQIITSLNDYLISTSTDPVTGVNDIDVLINPINQLIDGRLVPNDMINGGSLQTVFGTPASINSTTFDITPTDGIANAIAGYEISLTNIPSKLCSRIASHTYVVSKAQRITINGTVVKTPGVSEPDIGQLTVSCNNNNNTINIASEVYKKGIESIVNSNANAATRNKENKHYIAPMGENTSSAAAVCTGGATWDPTVSACICDVNSNWNGNSCVPVNSPNVGEAASCRFGYFWNQTTRTCQVMCPINQVYHPITNTCVAATNASKTLCIPGLDPANPAVCETVNNRVADTSAYGAGRRIPLTVLTPIIPVSPAIGTTTVHNPQIATSMPLNNSNAGSQACPAGSRPTLALNPINSSGTPASPIANYDGKVCQMCINGYWDNDRCVTR